MKNKILYIAFLLIFYPSAKLFAGFPVGKGRTVLSLAYNAYYSNRNFDYNWKAHSDNPGNYFLSHYFSAYIAHGISRKLDVFAAIPFEYEISKADTITKSRSDFADAMTGISYTIMDKNYSKYTSFKLAGIFPLYKGSTPLPIGYAAKGVDFTINYISSPKSMRYKGFIMIEESFRHYFDKDGPNQFSLELARSFTIQRFNYVILDIRGTFSSSPYKTPSLIPTMNKDFAYAELKLTYGRRVWRNVTLYLEGFYTPVGRNTGEGMGGSFLGVFKFP